MPVVPMITTLQQCAVNLPLYAYTLGIPECPFWGVDDGNTTGTCKTIWTLENRRNLSRALCEAQKRIEDILGYKLQPTWTTDEYHRINTGKQTYFTKLKKVIAGGVMAVSDIAINEPVIDLADPNVVGPIATTVTDTDEVRIYHHDSDQEIIPSSIEIAGGLLTIEIPLCRLVLPEYYDNSNVGWSLSDTVFAATVDVKRVYNDTSTQGKLIKANCCTASCDSEYCTEHTDDACIKVVNTETGQVEIAHATYSEGSWTFSRSYTCYNGVRLNYYSGLTELSEDLTDAVIRLAHSLMPHSPCGCDPIKRFWEADRNIPSVITAEREKCLFGISDGAWAAWRIINNPGLRIVTMGVM